MKIFQRIFIFLFITFAILFSDEAGVPAPQVFEKSPLVFRISLDRAVLKLNERIIAVFEAEFPAEYTAELQVSDEGVKQFRHELRQLPDVMANKKVTRGWEMTLEPALALPQLSIEGVKCVFSKSNGKGDDFAPVMEKQEITIDLPEEEYWQQLKVEDGLAGKPMERFANRGGRVWFRCALVLLVLVLCVCAAIFLYRRRHSGEVFLEVASPYDVALAALEALEAEGLLENGSFMEFYNRVQNILRSYIEARFGINAPEQTTEEFMEALRSQENSPITAYKPLLEKFMWHCDLVRFATYIPGRDEIFSTFKSCREFVLETKQQGETND